MGMRVSLCVSDHANLSGKRHLIMHAPLVCGEYGRMECKQRTDWHYSWKDLYILTCLEENAKHFRCGKLPCKV